MSEHAVQTIEQIFDDVTGYWRSAILWAAFDLHLPDHLRDGKQTPEQIAEAEGADARAVSVLLDALCGMGYLDKDDGRYKMVSLAETMLPTGTGSFGDAAPIWLNELFWDAWSHLPEVIRKGEPLEPAGIDHPFWEVFARASFGIAQFQGSMIAPLIGLPGSEETRVLDVGCGSGGVGYALAQADEKVKVVGLDGEAVLAIAADNARNLGLADRVEHRTTDLLSAPSLGEQEFDVAVLSHILHHCDEPSAAELIGKIAAALKSGGRIVINEFIPDEERKREAFPLMFSVLMMITSPGKTYTFEEISAWLGEAGFGEAARHDLVGHAAAITATKS